METKVFHFSVEGKDVFATLPWDFKDSTALILQNGTLIWIVGGTKFKYLTDIIVTDELVDTKVIFDYQPDKKTTIINLRSDFSINE